MPTTHITDADLAGGDKLIDLMALCGLAKSKGDARRLIDGGGVSIDGRKVEDVLLAIDRESLVRGVIVRKGKKDFHRVILDL